MPGHPVRKPLVFPPSRYGGFLEAHQFEKILLEFAALPEKVRAPAVKPCVAGVPEDETVFFIEDGNRVRQQFDCLFQELEFISVIRLACLFFAEHRSENLTIHRVQGDDSNSASPPDAVLEHLLHRRVKRHVAGASAGKSAFRRKKFPPWGNRISI